MAKGKVQTSLEGIALRVSSLQLILVHVRYVQHRCMLRRRMPCGGGFTLLELLIVLVIVSILVVAGSSGLLMDEDHMDSGVKLLVDVIHESRGVAISGNRPIEIHASAEKIQILHNDKPLRVEMFPPGVVLYAVNDKVLNNDYFSIFFNRFGISRDYVLILQEGEDFMTIYMPAVGSPHILKNLISLDDARKECL